MMDFRDTVQKGESRWSIKNNIGYIDGSAFQFNK